VWDSNWFYTNAVANMDSVIVDNGIAPIPMAIQILS